MHEAPYCFDTAPMADFAALCGRFTGNSLQSPYRSTVPLLSLIEHGRPTWDALLESWGAPTDAAVHLEYCVPSPKPRGNPSQTDAMLLSGSAVWAIEAKWTESRYETVEKRLRKPESDGGDPRLTVEGWLRHLQPYAAGPLRLQDFHAAVYQILHRAASACAVAAEGGRAPHLVYLHFQPFGKTGPTPNYVRDLGDLFERLGRPRDLTFEVVDMPLQPTPAFELIKDLDKSSRDTSAKVLDALCRGPLFTFGTPERRPIRGSA